MHFTNKDFTVTWFRGTGAGGQYRNKHQNCCRIIHDATGLMATGQSYRERPANQKEAFNRLAQKIIAYYAEPDPERRKLTNVVRTYHFERGVADDGSVSKPVDNAMNGDLDDFILNALNGNRVIRETGRM
jgi:protein subunit release factor B